MLLEILMLAFLIMIILSPFALLGSIIEAKKKADRKKIMDETMKEFEKFMRDYKSK